MTWIVPEATPTVPESPASGNTEVINDGGERSVIITDNDGVAVPQADERADPEPYCEN